MFPKNWQNFLLVIAIVVILAQLFFVIFKRVILKLTIKTKTDIDDLIASKTHFPIFLVIIFSGLKYAFDTYNLFPEYLSIIHGVLNTFLYLVFIQIAVILSDIFFINIAKKISQKTKSDMDDQVLDLLHKSSSIIIWTLGFLLILSFWGINVGPALAGLGVAGLAVAFALQKTLGNIFGGISLILDKNMKTGDVIDVNADGLQKGKVIDIGLRSTKLQTFDKEVLIVPNGNLADAAFINVAQPGPSIRIVVPFGVEYGSNIKKVKKLVIKEIENVEGLDKNEDINVRFLEMADSALNFKAYFYIKNYSDKLSALDQANTLIYEVLNKNKIGIPFPQMDVHMKK